MRPWLSLAASLVMLGACGDSSDELLDAALDASPLPDADPPDVSAPVDVPDVGPSTGPAIRGQVLYEKRLFDTEGFTGEREQVAGRRVRVELLSEAGRKLAETFTDETGAFAFAYDEQEADMRVFVRAWADARFRSQRATAEPFVSGNETYSFDSEVFAQGDGSDISMLATIDSGIGGAFNIVEYARVGLELIEPHIASPTPHITFGWERGRAWPCGSCYGDNYIQLGGQVEDPDEYDDDIVLHELGHHIVHHHSADDSFGGPHRDRQVEPTLAYGEGVAYFFSSMALGRPLILDNYLGDNRYIDIENMTFDGVPRTDFVGTSDGTAFGRLREEIITGIMWDAFDAARPEEPFDTVEIGEAGMFEILFGYFGTWPHTDQGASGIDLADFLHALSCRDDVSDAEAQALADDRGFPWSPTPADCE